jgi:hypothetical protein
MRQSPLSGYPRVMSRVGLSLLVVLLGACIYGGVAHAQFFREGSFATRLAPEEMPDGNFVICRLAYQRVRQEESGIGWQTDYPYAEINLTTRLSELTRTRVSRDHNGTPNYYVVRATDPMLFNCPVLVASDVGTIGLGEREAAGLRDYLLKGGFLWVDDFWGTRAWEQWESEISRVLAPGEYPIQDVDLSDPMLHSMFQIERVPQITNILFWRRNGEYTSERGSDSEEVHLRAIRDGNNRVMVLMTHNTDVADAWEREGEDPGFFLQFSPPGYALGIDVLLHAMTH